MYMYVGSTAMYMYIHNEPQVIGRAQEITLHVQVPKQHEHRHMQGALVAPNNFIEALLTLSSLLFLTLGLWMLLNLLDSARN